MPGWCCFLMEPPACLSALRRRQHLSMSQHVSLLVFLLGVLTSQMKGVLGLSDESSNSSPGYRKSYYVVQMLPMQRLKEGPEDAYYMKAVPLLVVWPSSVFGAPDIIRPTAGTVAHSQPQPVPVIHRQSPSTLAPPLMGSTALRVPVLTLSTESKTSKRNGEASAPGNLGAYCGVSARFSLTPQVLTTPGLPRKGALHSTSFPTSSPTREPRGDM
ncbi:uncharacterized protein LOC141579395 [Camelus bactrianus]|uniref:Uncharacterized protein LOC141579395 n=1 Tax=Camelus bactrianus TaxID=9837 RepID=A0AC58R978_CAMBA